MIARCQNVGYHYEWYEFIMFMKRVYLVLLTFWSIILLSGCSSQIVIDDALKVDPIPTPTVEVEHVDSVPSMHISINDDTGFMDKEVAAMRAIPLETSEDYLIGSITDLYVVGDTIVVVDGQKARQIFLFDLEGKFLSKIGNVGTGPGEYASILHALANSDCISIRDNLTAKYISYDYSGNVLGEIEFSRTSPSIVMSQSDGVLLATYASYYESDPFALQWLEGDSVVATALPYTIKRAEIAPEMFRLGENEIGLTIPMNDTIYSITGRQIVPKFTLGLISEDEALEWKIKSAKMDLQEKNNYILQNHYKPADFISVHPGQDYYIIEFQIGATPYIAVVDKKTLKSRSYLRSNRNPITLYLPPYIKSINGNTLVGYMTDDYYHMVPEESREFIEKYFSSQDQELLKDYDYDNNNPIVWLMDLK